MNKFYIYVFLIVASFISPLLWGQDALIIQATQGRQDPSATSQKITDVASKKSVKVLDKKGFWAKIEVDGKSGWVKLSDIELPSISNNIDPLSTGRAANGNIVNTAGVRGLSPEELKGAKPNTAALEVAIKNSELIKDSDIANFISGGGLAPKSSTPQIKAVKTTLTGNTETTETSKNTSTSNKKTGKPTKENNDDKDW